MKLLSSDTIRRCFIADEGMLLGSTDFDQIELRIAAALAGETKLIEAAKRGESLHVAAAVNLFGEDCTPDQYRYTKNLNFGWLFGGGAPTLSEQTGLPLETSQDIVTQYTTEFAELTAYKRRKQEAVLREALNPKEYAMYKSLRRLAFSFRDTPTGRREAAAVKRQITALCRGKLGYVTTIYGRRLPVEAETAYRVVNYEVQSTACDVMADKMLRVMADKMLAPTALLPIHDEILWQAPEHLAERIARRYTRIMSTEFMGVPLTASSKVYGRSWGDGYSY